MFLSYKSKEKLRNYAPAIFHSTKWSLDRRRYVFYLIIKQDLLWIKTTLKEIGLEDEEIDSEIYLLSIRLFDDFDSQRSSIIPYLEKHINWKVSSLISKYKNIYKNIIELPIEESEYEIENEYYLKSPNFLFENKWVGKNLSLSQKNLILKILTTDFANVRDLANECRLSKSTIATQLQDIAAVLKEGYQYVKQSSQKCTTR